MTLHLPRPLVLALVLMALFAVGLFASASTASWSTPVTPAPVAQTNEAVSASVTDRAIGFLQERLRLRSDDSKSQVALGLSYLQKARETGDPSYYARAQSALQQVLDGSPQDVDALVGMGTLALARHEFSEALTFGQQAVTANPYRAASYGVVGDALVELGRYPEAIEAVQKMVDIHPDQTSYARISYLRELHGDMPGAIVAMTDALDAGLAGTEGTEWTRVQLGNLYFNTGDLASAEAAYQESLSLYPDYVYATAGLAQVAAARGQNEDAIRLYSDAARVAPLPQFVGALADLYLVTGRTQDAEQQLGLARAMQQLFSANGVKVDSELALIDADHDVNLPQAVEHAKDEWSRRQSVHVADVYAWALFKNGQCQEAQAIGQQALRLGGRDALMHFHAAQIANCVGDQAGAVSHLQQALAINPYFSVRYAPQAQAMLAQLQGAQR